MIKYIALVFIGLLANFSAFAQSEETNVKVSGLVIEKDTNLPLEFAIISFEDVATKKTFGNSTDLDGKFNFEIPKGTYNIKFDFISFKSFILSNQTINTDINFGSVKLETDAVMLDNVVVIAEKSTVEIKLDKRVYNVGKDMIVKGGTVSDVLDNVPSVTVSSEGTVALRGNENVRILIDGKPSGLAGINIADALKLLPADSVEKVEVITNPSARYDAEGGGGIINIVLRKGKVKGINGSFVASAGNPESHGLSSTLNYRAGKFNLFSNLGYNNRTSLGRSKTDTEYLNPTNPNSAFINEKRNNRRNDNGYNANFGMEWFLTDNLSWTNAVTFRQSDETNPDNVYFYNFDADKKATFTRNRYNEQSGDNFSMEYSTNFTQKFKKDGHQLTVDMAFSENRENDFSTIEDQVIGNPSTLFRERTGNNEKQHRNLFQADYVLPIGKNARFEAGYRGNFQRNLTDFSIDSFINNDWVANNFYSNILEYKEFVNAFYAQYGSKVSKFSYFLGLRFEDSNIDVNSLTINNYNKKRYNNLFPTATFNYEFSDDASVSLSYSKRINRPRGRFLNPFSSYSSNINIFQGNPDLNPAFSNVFDVGYLKKWNKITFNTSAYINITENSFQFIRKESGNFVDGVPVILTTAINLAKEYRSGFEFNVNYTPYKWWRLNTSLNIFRNEINGEYKYTNYLGNEVVQVFSNVANSMFTRLSSKVTLPYKVDFQTNITYNAPQTNAQGKSLSQTAVNLAFSKDVLKDKGTIALNVSDLFNSRVRRAETYLPNVSSSYSEFQWRARQITVSFTYRFNNSKNDKERKQPSREMDDEFMG